MNLVTIIGNVGKNPELRYTKNGKARFTMTVATTRKVRDEDQTTWHNVECWDKLAENCGASIQTGNRVFVTGRLSTYDYEDRETGKKKTVVSIVALEAGLALSKYAVVVETE
jgi:single-strand DNA-binding protein